LHTNDSPSAITRLINMGVESYLISAALNMILAQRLARRVCPKCRTAYDPPRTLRKALERMGYGMDKFFKGAGCRKCRNTGYSGRCGIHEILLMNDELRDAVVSNASVAQLRRIGVASGMVTLRHDGIRKVREGLTSIDEVMQIAGESATSMEQRAAAETTLTPAS